uniref:Sec-independent protein translocase component TatC n=1 Tax=Lympha mucosa TaxID=2045360 RepID=A0A2D1BK77_9FLOR|nr:Sec-independent protein translocase component TatC [Lympha mucosa]ATN23373.1 Sec-independent protein translocase component TatC [Lympha mucosa]
MFNMTMVYPVTVYFKEIIWRLFYCLLSSFIVFFIAFYHIELLFLFEIYPFIKFTHKKFIATHVTELFNSVIQTCFFVIYISEFPFIAYHIITFISTGWFVYQIIILRFYIILLTLLTLLTFLFTNTYLLPQIFDFFTQWETLQNATLLHLEIDARIHLYLIWINHMYSFINFLFSFFLTSLLLLILFTSPYYFYLYLKYYKKQTVLIIIFLFMVIFPPDFWIQLIIIIFSILFLEITFFISCLRLNQLMQISDSSIG